MALSFWKSNARKVFAVNEGDLIRRSKKDTSSNIAPAALGSFFFPLTSKLISLAICHDHMSTLLVRDCFYIAWLHPDVTNFREH